MYIVVYIARNILIISHFKMYDEIKNYETLEHLVKNFQRLL